MKEQILEIADKLRNGEVDSNEAQNLLLCLFGVSGSFISVSEQEPPHYVELLAKSPRGIIHLCSWRPSYNIFTCQAKSERSWDWEWKLI
jgi:hypothetical protein